MILNISKIMNNIDFFDEGVFYQGGATISKNNYIYDVLFIYGKGNSENEFQLTIEKINGLEVKDELKKFAEIARLDLINFLEKDEKIKKEILNFEKKFKQGLEEILNSKKLEISLKGYYEDVFFEIITENGCVFDVILFGGNRRIEIENISIPIYGKEGIRKKIVLRKYMEEKTDDFYILLGNIIENISRKGKIGKHKALNFVESLELEECLENVRIKKPIMKMIQKEMEENKKERLKMIVGEKYETIMRVYFSEK